MSRTILLADDSSTIQRIVELAFADEAGLRVVTASTGEEALRLIQQTQPDLLLADVVMPGPSGYDLCRQVKDSDRPIPVALLAGTFEPFDRARAEACSADDFLVKPFESDRLKELCQRLLRGERTPFHGATFAPIETLDSDARGKSPAVADSISVDSVAQETDAAPAETSGSESLVSETEGAEASARTGDGPDAVSPKAQLIAIEEVEPDGGTVRGLTVTSIHSATSAEESKDTKASAADHNNITTADTSGASAISAEEIDLIVERVLERLTRAAVGDWVRDQLPAIAREVVTERIRDLEKLDTSEP